MNPVLPYNPGVLPTRSGPSQGESVVIEVNGMPPIKTLNRSLRNRTNPRYDAFVALREAATHAMDGRAWYFGSVKVGFTLRCTENSLRGSLNDYFGGIADSLDGSAGFTFTYLPIVFQDDSQISEYYCQREESAVEKYRVEVFFL